MSWSRRSNRHNRASVYEDEFDDDWAARDQPSGSYSGYAAGNSHSQHGSYNPGYGGSSYTSQNSQRGSYNPGYGGSSYTSQNSYSNHGGADPNYGRSQQQQYQEQSGGHGSQRSQGYDSEEEEDFEARSQIRLFKDQSVRDTRKASNSPIETEVSGSGILNHVSTQGHLHNTESRLYGAFSQNHFADTTGQGHGNLTGSTFVPNVGNSLGSRSRAQEEGARTLARQVEREGSYRARESSHGNRYRSQYSSGGGYY
ncbi:hypothetical protein B9Z19DRAFT_1076699 [Tuber borchii]|uniref:Uncharacterized protein n=1 Tax=Tuber borchii TaxID=42251 RepID=A0A2T7A1S8_TUBBO|nr:hypothetical protein B9Z19DRAFT_1076699 [Tuber borchii]